MVGLLFSSFSHPVKTSSLFQPETSACFTGMESLN